jgi:hypothetical protein
MTITFENDNDVIVYALEKVIFYAKRTQQILVAQCVWWLASVIGLEQSLVNYISNKQARKEVIVLLRRHRIKGNPYHHCLEIFKKI